MRMSSAFLDHHYFKRLKRRAFQNSSNVASAKKNSQCAPELHEPRNLKKRSRYDHRKNKCDESQTAAHSNLRLFRETHVF